MHIFFAIIYIAGVVASALFYRVGCAIVGEDHELVHNFSFSLIWWAFWPTVTVAWLLNKYLPGKS